MFQPLSPTRIQYTLLARYRRTDFRTGRKATFYKIVNESDEPTLHVPVDVGDRTESGEVLWSRGKVKHYTYESRKLQPDNLLLRYQSKTPVGYEGKRGSVKEEKCTSKIVISIF